MERSLVILKPDAVERRLIGAIIGQLEGSGMRIVGAKMVIASDELLRRHYPDTLAPIIGGKSVAAGTDVGPDPAAYGRMVLGWNRKYMSRGPVLAMVVEGENCIQKIRDVVGATDPPNAAPGTIRAKFAADNIAKANAEKRGTENLVHASGSRAEADFEIPLWFPDRDSEIFSTMGSRP